MQVLIFIDYNSHVAIDDYLLNEKNYFQPKLYFLKMKVITKKNKTVVKAFLYKSYVYNIEVNC